MRNYKIRRKSARKAGGALKYKSWGPPNSTLHYTQCDLIFSAEGATQNKCWNGPVGSEVLLLCIPERYSVLSSWRREPVLGGFWALTFTRHHRARLKSLLAGTFKTSNHIFAGPIAARVAHRTLISVYTRPRRNTKDELRCNGTQISLSFHQRAPMGKSCVMCILFLQERNVHILSSRFTAASASSVALVGTVPGSQHFHCPSVYSPPGPHTGQGLSPMSIRAPVVKPRPLHAVRSLCLFKDGSVPPVWPCITSLCKKPQLQWSLARYKIED